MSGPVITEMGDRVQVHFPIPDTFFGMSPTSHPRPTQPSIPPGSVNEYQLWLGRQRRVRFFPLVDVRGVCRYNCEISRERMPYLSALEVCSRRGAIQIHVYLYLTLPLICTEYPPVDERGETDTTVHDSTPHMSNVHSYYSSQPASFDFSAPVSD